MFFYCSFHDIFIISACHYIKIYFEYNIFSILYIVSFLILYFNIFFYIIQYYILLYFFKNSMLYYFMLHYIIFD